MCWLGATDVASEVHDEGGAVQPVIGRRIDHKLILPTAGESGCRAIICALKTKFQGVVRRIPSGIIVHQPTVRVTALIHQNISVRLGQQGTGIGGGKCFQFLIITLRHGADV